MCELQGIGEMGEHVLEVVDKASKPKANNKLPEDLRHHPGGST